jgi:hypothetical protein
MSMPSKLLYNPTLHAPVTNDLHIATKAYVDSMSAANDAMQYKGAINASANPTYPASLAAGETYKISVAGRIGGASGPQVEVGDMIISTAAAGAGTHAEVGTSWTILQTNMVQATTEATGFVELATKTEANARTDTVRAVTPASLADFALKIEAGIKQSSGVGSPIYTVTPTGPGEFYFDVQHKIWWISSGDSSGSWYMMQVNANEQNWYPPNTAAIDVSLDMLCQSNLEIHGGVPNADRTLYVLNVPAHGSTMLHYRGSFTFFSGASARKLTLKWKNTFNSTEGNLNVQWAGNSVCPAIAGTQGANENYRIFFHARGPAETWHMSWEAVGHSRGAPLTSTSAETLIDTALAAELPAYAKTVYRDVTNEDSGTILASAHGIGNQYLSVSAYEDGTPNVPVGIDCTIAANGDIAWSASTSFTGYIVVSGATTPVSI